MLRIIHTYIPISFDFCAPRCDVSTGDTAPRVAIYTFKSFAKERLLSFECFTEAFSNDGTRVFRITKSEDVS